jgi:hypothetical protein
MVPADVAQVVVGVQTAAGPSEARAATLPPGLAGVTQRAFAVALPEGATITSLTGLDAAGAADLTAPDLSALGAVAGFDPTATATVPVG